MNARALLLAAVAGAALAPSASALQEPRPGPGDPRMRVADANDSEVFRLVATLRSTVQIILPPGERSIGGAGGDTLQWEVLPASEDGTASNILTVKPKDFRGGLPTTISIVATTEDGRARAHQFEAVAREGSIELDPKLRDRLNDAVRRGAVLPPEEDVMLSITFTDRQKANRAAAAAAQERRRAVEAEQVRHRQAVAFYEGPRNWSYSATESPLREGLEVSDNGHSTVFRFPGNLPASAIFAVADKPGEPACSGKDEERVQRIPQGETVIVPMVLRCFRLRLGDDVVGVRNDAFTPAGVNHGTGTNTPDVVREPRPASRRPVRTAAR